MKIVVDDKIPYIREKLSVLADEVVYLGGAAITAADVCDADALIVRTRTRCNEQLLKGSKVQFVATATIGFDHLDTEYLSSAGIYWTNCPGCNSGSVAQYVECSLLLLQRQKGFPLQKMTLGIVGCGHVGSKVRAMAERLGMRTLVCDPPLAASLEPLAADSGEPMAASREPMAKSFVPLEVIEREADIVTFHVPLTKEGPHATWHLADKAFFSRLPRVPIIINTSRGEVVDNAALLTALQQGQVREAVLDVWEGEPSLNQELLQRAFIATPHIAGYSADGKVNADNQVIDALCRHFHLPHPGKIVPPALPDEFHYTGDALQLYNPLDDTQKLKSEPQKFEALRNNYPLRREQI
ncbi:MAG: 4-phosphoerythronate dehydrogenase [Prevotella sp.]|nr:4-phosphoerythronate dehydrogenase [Prevotella sp.]